MISFHHKGDWRRTERYLTRVYDGDYMKMLDAYGRMGVEALASATPKDSGKTSESWGYEIQNNGKSTKIVWFNTNVNDGFNVAVGIQYGHGTRTGGYVAGRDYINPAIRPIFDHIAEEIGREVSRD